MRITHLPDAPGFHRNQKRVFVDATEGDKLDNSGIAWVVIVVEDTHPIKGGETNRAYSIYVSYKDRRDDRWEVSALAHPGDDVLVDEIVEDYLKHRSNRA